METVFRIDLQLVPDFLYRLINTLQYYYNTTTNSTTKKLSLIWSHQPRKCTMYTEENISLTASSTLGIAC